MAAAVSIAVNVRLNPRQRKQCQHSDAGKRRLAKLVELNYVIYNNPNRLFHLFSAKRLGGARHQQVQPFVITLIFFRHTSC